MVSGEKAAAIRNYHPRSCELLYRPYGATVSGPTYRDTITPAQYCSAESYCTQHDRDCPLMPHRRLVRVVNAVLSAMGPATPAISPGASVVNAPEIRIVDAPVKPFPPGGAQATAQGQLARVVKKPAASPTASAVRMSVLADDSEEHLPRRTLDEGYNTAPDSPAYRP